jgi:alpha-L-rhamnosidase
MELGIGESHPRLSWHLPAGAHSQEGYRLDLSDLGMFEVVSGDHVLVPWPGRSLGSAERVEWRVQAQTNRGESEWSDPSWFETGLLTTDDWKAKWIEAASPRDANHVLRRTFSLEQPTSRARLYATAHGIYEVFLNGCRVGTLELTPGFTSYPVRLQVQTYDVARMLRVGTNLWEVVLTDGWFRGRTGFTQARNGYGDKLAFLAQLHADDIIVTTGPEWESGAGPIQTADLMAGQSEDRRIVPGMWRPVTIGDYDLSRLVCSPAPPVRRIQELQPVAVGRIGPERHVVDFGQNINGWVRLSGLGPKGSDIRLCHGEIVDAEGDVSQENLHGFDPATGSILDVGQTDTVVSAGAEDDTFEPRHTTHGFQFVRIDGLPGRLDPYHISGVVVHTDLRRVGSFQCSDPRLNRLHDAAEWSFRDNACDIPTDCPQRERAGWTGDWQIFLPAAAFLYDVGGFSTKWLRDLASEQLPDGRIPNFAPDPHRYSETPSPLPIEPGSSGWGDAIVMVPWEMWRVYGDDAILAEMWPSMVAWLDYCAKQARENRSESRRARHPEPPPHEAFVWDTGFHWGEWLEPGAPSFPMPGADHSAVATAYLCHSARLMSRVAGLLGYDSEREKLEDYSASVLEAWQREFVSDEGVLDPNTQATYVRSLAFDLIPTVMRQRVADHLVELIRRAGTHLGTGFLSTPYLLPVLADTGHVDIAYDLLFQDTPPSWLWMIKQGATTIWESWGGDQGGGMVSSGDEFSVSSRNHYSKGAVVSFLHRYVAGIRNLDSHPGYRRFRVQPVLDPRLDWARATHESPYGLIESSWRREGQHILLNVTVPPGSLAEVVLPDGTSREQFPGTAAYSAAPVLDRSRVD